jgi:hypothetical protein
MLSSMPGIALEAPSNVSTVRREERMFLESLRRKIEMEDRVNNKRNWRRKERKKERKEIFNPSNKPHHPYSSPPSSNKKSPLHTCPPSQACLIGVFFVHQHPDGNLVTKC